MFHTLRADVHNFLRIPFRFRSVPIHEAVALGYAVVCKSAAHGHFIKNIASDLFNIIETLRTFPQSALQRLNKHSPKIFGSPFMSHLFFPVVHAESHTERSQKKGVAVVLNGKRFIEAVIATKVPDGIRNP